MDPQILYKCSEKELKYAKEYYQKNKEQINAKKREYYQKNKELIKTKFRKYYQNHKEQYAILNKAYQQQHRERYLEHKRKFKQKRRLIVLIYYGGDPPKCACCGESHTEFLTIDHINNDGAEHRKRIGGSGNLVNWLIQNNYPKGYQILCSNCNCAKGSYGYCPHEKERITVKIKER